MNEDKEKLYSIYLNEKLNLIFDIDDSKDETIESSYPQIISYRTNDYHKRCYLEDKEGNQIGNYYEEIRDFSEGYAAVKFEDSFTYNFIDKNGKLLSEDRYTGVGNFKNGYAWVERSEKPSYNFIDKSGNPVSEKWFHDIDKNGFSNGCALVRLYDGWNYINENGNFIRERGFSGAEGFTNGIAHVTTSGGHNFINTKGQKIFEKGFSYCERANNGCYIVLTDFAKKRNHNIVGPNGVLAREEGFNEISNNRNKDFLYVKNAKCNVYDTREGRLVCNQDYDEVCCYNKFIVVKDNDKYAFINRKTGDLLTGEWYDSVFYLGDLFIVRNNKKCNIINESGEPLCKEWYKDIVRGYSDGRIIVQRNDYKVNFVDSNGQLISDMWYDDTELFNECFAPVAKRKMGIKYWNYIDLNGNLITDWTREQPTITSHNDSVTFFKTSSKEFSRARTPRYFGKYKVEKHLKVYKCVSKDDSFTLKYEPIHIYGSRYVVCDNKERIYLYDRKYDSYKELYIYDENNINRFTDNFIFHYGKVYLMYNNKMIDITYFYDRKLKNKKFKIKDNVDIISDEEFYDGDADIIRKRYEKVLEEIEEYKKKQQDEEEQKRIEEIRIKQESERQKLIEKKTQTIKILNAALQNLEEYEKKVEVIDTERFHVSNILIDCGDHKEINPICFEVGLRRVDFSFMPLKNVKLAGLDLSGTNISFSRNDPQEIYKRDLSQCNLTGVVFLPGTIFDEVHIEGSSFTTDGSDRTMDLSEESFRKAYYDDKTTLNGIPLVELLKEEKQNRR